jgi:dihydropteroate synthase
VRAALRRHGWDPERAAETAAGLEAADIAIDGLQPEEIDALVAWAVRAGVECVTGPDWAIVAGSRARLAGLARGTGAQPNLARVGAAVGQCLTEPPPTRSWHVRDRLVLIDRPIVMGIVNITPDSFSDGGRFLQPADAIEHGLRLLDDGADLLDLGAESTRPNRTAALPPSEERFRLLPVLEGLVEQRPDVLLSVDTVHAETARAALDAGASVVNDVTGLRHDPQLAHICAEAGAGLVIMHSRGSLLEIAEYGHAAYGDDPAGDVAAELAAAAELAEAAGVARERIVVDPGLGFSKRPEHNWQVLHGLEAIVALGFPVLIGPSRKRFLGEATGRSVDQRDDASGAACALGWARGAQIFRVHDVGRVRDALTVADAWERA